MLRLRSGKRAWAHLALLLLLLLLVVRRCGLLLLVLLLVLELLLLLLLLLQCGLLHAGSEKPLLISGSVGVLPPVRPGDAGRPQRCSPCSRGLPLQRPRAPLARCPPVGSSRAPGRHSQLPGAVTPSY